MQVPCSTYNPVLPTKPSIQDCLVRLLFAFVLSCDGHMIGDRCNAIIPLKSDSPTRVPPPAAEGSGNSSLSKRDSQRCLMDRICSAFGTAKESGTQLCRCCSRFKHGRDILSMHQSARGNDRKFSLAFIIRINTKRP